MNNEEFQKTMAQDIANRKAEEMKNLLVTILSEVQELKQMMTETKTSTRTTRKTKATEE